MGAFWAERAMLALLIVSLKLQTCVHRTTDQRVSRIRLVTWVIIVPLLFPDHTLPQPCVSLLCIDGAPHADAIEACWIPRLS